MSHHLDAIARRYQSLTIALRSCGFSATEAAACIDAHKRGDPYSGEAVNHSGGVVAVLRHAIARRGYCYGIRSAWRAQRAFERTDDAWSAALVKAFGRHAGDRRYSAAGKGAEGSTLRHLYEERERARVWHDRTRSGRNYMNAMAA